MAVHFTRMFFILFLIDNILFIKCGCRCWRAKNISRIFQLRFVVVGLGIDSVRNPEILMFTVSLRKLKAWLSRNQSVGTYETLISRRAVNELLVKARNHHRIKSVPDMECKHKLDEMRNHTVRWLDCGLGLKAGIIMHVWTRKAFSGFQKAHNH